MIERAIVGSEMVIEDGTIIRPEKNVDDVVLIAEGNRKGDEMNGRKMLELLMQREVFLP